MAPRPVPVLTCTADGCQAKLVPLLTISFPAAANACRPTGAQAKLVERSYRSHVGVAAGVRGKEATKKNAMCVCRLNLQRG